MIDVAGKIEDQGIDEAEEQDQRPDRGPASAKRFCKRCRPAHQREEEEDGPGGQRQRFAESERIAEKHQRGERRIHHARPLEERALRRIHAMLREIEPALPAEQVAHLSTRITLQPGDRLFALGTGDQLERLEKLIASP